MGKLKRPKRQFSRKGQRAVCGCTAMNGEPKTLFSEQFLARKRAGDTMGPEGKMWQTYKCPNPKVTGWHIGTVRWDPWKRFESNSHSPQGVES